jgi:hypothetical protein
VMRARSPGRSGSPSTTPPDRTWGPARRRWRTSTMRSAGPSACPACSAESAR